MTVRNLKVPTNNPRHRHRWTNTFTIGKSKTRKGVPKRLGPDPSRQT